MLILFSSAAEGDPMLANLHIKDSSDLTNVPVAGNTGWDNDFLQAQTLCSTPMLFGTEETGLVATNITSDEWYRRKSKALVKVNFSNAGANTVLRPLYQDSAGITSVGSTVTVTAIAKQEGALYMAPIEVFETYGSDKMSFIIESISVGTVNISSAGV